MVLRDLQQLQNMISVVDMSGVILRYTESLLSSGRHANIELAASVMEGLVDSDDSVQLILTAWRHYYSNAGSLLDNDLDLARKVLSLAPEGVREVQDCYDLIAALQSLADFGLHDVLPVTVLNCQDRMEFVRRALQVKPTAYKNTQRLMKLASLLKVCQGEGVEGVVWATIARRALQLGDTSAAHTACNNFILAGYREGWDICYALAAQAGQESGKCGDLLSFAVAHCDNESLMSVLASLLTMEQRNMTRTVEARLAGSSSEETDAEVFDDAVEDDNGEVTRDTREVSPLATVLNIPSLTTQFLRQHQAAPAAIWQLSQNLLTQSLTNSNGHASCDDSLDTSFSHSSFPCFYSSLYPECRESGLDTNYGQFVSPCLVQNQSVVSYHLLRLSLLSATVQCLSEGEEDEEGGKGIPPDLLAPTLPLLASQDILLALSINLSTPTPVSMQALDNLPRSLPSLCYCLLYLAIIKLSSMNKQCFHSTPKQLVSMALKLSRGDKDSVSKELLRYQELLTDSHQGEQLSGGLVIFYWVSSYDFHTRSSWRCGCGQVHQ